MEPKRKNRIRTIKARVTEEQYEKILNKAEKANMNMSDFVRQSIMSAAVIDTGPLIDLVREVNRIGNNINQATHVMHIYCDPEGGDFDYIAGEFDKLKKTVYEFVERFSSWPM